MEDKYLLDLEQHIDIRSTPEKVFEGIIAEISEKMHYPDGRSMNMQIERRPGGRWYRNLGDESGHLWGFVQTIKAPELLEITGPLFMSYPVSNHLEFRVTATDDGARLSLRHRAFGLLDENHRKGVAGGWRGMMEEVKKSLEA